MVSVLKSQTFSKAVNKTVMDESVIISRSSDVVEEFMLLAKHKLLH